MTRAWLLPLSVLCAFALVPLASAHAELRSAEPAPNGHVDPGVTQITLTFSEAVDHSYTGVDITDLNGTSVTDGPTTFDATRANAIHRSVLPLRDGIYTVAWKALSADSHTVRGGYLFTVGNATLKYAAPVSASDNAGDYSIAATVKEGTARFAFYAGAFIALGAPLYVLLIARVDPPRRLLITIAFAALVGAGGALLGLSFLAARTDSSLIAASSTIAGRSFVWRAGLAALAGVSTVVGLRANVARQRTWLGATLALAAAALFAASLGSHAAADEQYHVTSVTFDALHLWMGALWIGGVVGMLLVLPGENVEDVTRQVSRFSPYAMASVGLVLATGTYASVRHLNHVNDLWTERYGLLVSAKIAILGALVAFGAVHQRVLTPHLQRGGHPNRFRRVLAAEALVMASVLLVAGVLASTSPPAGVVQEGTQGPSLYFELSNSTKRTHVILDIQPNPPVVGLTKIIIAFHPLNPPTLPNGTVAALKLVPPGEKEPGNPTILNQTAPGEWTLENASFTKPGSWKIIVFVQRPDEFARVSFDVPVALPGQTTGGAP